MEASWKATTKNVEMNFLYALVLQNIFPTLLETKEFLIKVDVPLIFFQMWILSTAAFFWFLFLTTQLASLTQILNRILQEAIYLNLCTPPISCINLRRQLDAAEGGSALLY